MTEEYTEYDLNTNITKTEYMSVRRDVTEAVSVEMCAKYKCAYFARKEETKGKTHNIDSGKVNAQC